MNLTTVCTILSLSILGFSCQSNKCKNGFRNSKWNNLRIKTPCIKAAEAQGLVFRIEANQQKNDSTNFVDLVFYNPTDSVRTIYWYTFSNSVNSIPLSCHYSVQEEKGTYIWRKFHPSLYMDPPVYHSYKKTNEKIEIHPLDTLKRTVKLSWIGKKAGQYSFTLYYLNDVLTSNTIKVNIRN